MNKRNSKTPKNIYPVPNSTRFKVLIQSRVDRKLMTIGTFDTISEAVEARDNFILDHSEDLTKGYLPRGISRHKQKFQSRFSFRSEQIHIGLYDTIEKAVEARNNFIDSLR